LDIEDDLVHGIFILCGVLGVTNVKCVVLQNDYFGGELCSWQSTLYSVILATVLFLPALFELGLLDSRQQNYAAGVRVYTALMITLHLLN
jgi:hypothetical protein